MTPSLQPLLQTTILRWGSRPRPRHAFQIQQYVFYGTKNKKNDFPYYTKSRSENRKELLRRLSFPRKYMPIHSKIWWTIKRTPLLLKTLIVVGPRRMQTLPPPEKKGVAVKSRIGRLFYHLVTHPEIYELLGTTFEPWGVFYTNSGKSMRPTYSGNKAISYSSYTYIEKQNVSLGDVVVVLGPEWDSGTGIMCKRVAALEGARLYVTTGRYRTQHIRQIPPGHCFVLGDNPPQSGDSRQWGPLPIEAVWAKDRWRWGLDGFHWISHKRYPWLENNVIEHLAPGQNRPTQREPLIKQPQKKPVVVHRPKVKPPPPPSPSPLKK